MISYILSTFLCSLQEGKLVRLVKLWWVESDEKGNPEEGQALITNLGSENVNRH